MQRLRGQRRAWSLGGMGVSGSRDLDLTRALLRGAAGRCTPSSGAFGAEHPHPTGRGSANPRGRDLSR